jgi:hypothetical protein
MSIRDWFGGGRKKEEYHQKLKEAVSDGKINAAEIAELEKLRESLDVDDIADDKTKIRREVYNEAADAVRASGKMTATEAAELARIQKFLALRDDQIDNTRRDLVRLRLLSEIRAGKLPVIPSGSPSVRGLALGEGEIAHYAFSAEVFDQLGGAGGNDDGVPIVAGKPPEDSSTDMPAGGANSIGEGQLVVTSQRLIFRGAKNNYAFKFGADMQMFLYRDGIRLPKKLGNTLLRAKSPESLRIAAELITKVMR